jgi:hypothetical protein
MILDKYDFKADSENLNFEFFSEGPRGRIKKVIRFNKLDSLDSGKVTYNLGFGDYNEVIDDIDDFVTSDNKDSQKILATVAKAAISFTDRYPTAYVFAKGSTQSRTRFYVMGISRNLKEVTALFEIWGAVSETEWELFKKNKAYIALLAKRK